MRPRLQPVRRVAQGKALSARRLEQARARLGEDDGLTIIEMIVTILIISLVVPVVLLLVTNIFQQSQNVHDTILGVQQDQTAGQSLLEYLHAAIVILPGSNATTLNASILAGVDSSGTETATLNAVFTNSANPKIDAYLTTSLTPEGPDGPGRTTSIGTYNAVNSPAVFTYYYDNYSSTPVGLASTNTPTNSQLSEIVAVGINVEFLAGPHKPVYGFHAVHASDFQTTIYLQNAAGAPAPTSATTVAATGTLAVNSPVTLTATVTPVPDGGNVNFTVTFGGTALSVCTTSVPVSTVNGTATCTFTPSSGGTYDVTAAFSGTDDFQPSTSAVTAIVVPLATTTSISESTSKSGSQDTMTVTATVSPSAATGPVEFTLQVCTTGFFGSCQNYSGAVNVSGGTAVWTQGGLRSGGTYTLSAAFVPPGGSTYSGSTSQTLTGTLP